MKHWTPSHYSPTPLFRSPPRFHLDEDHGSGSDCLPQRTSFRIEYPDTSLSLLPGKVPRSVAQGKVHNGILQEEM